MAELSLYQDAEGHQFNMTAEHAASLGYTPVKKGKAVAAVEEAPAEKAQPAAANKMITSASNKARR